MKNSRTGKLAELFLGFRERPIRDDRLAVSLANGHSARAKSLREWQREQLVDIRTGPSGMEEVTNMSVFRGRHGIQ